MECKGTLVSANVDMRANEVRYTFSSPISPEITDFISKGKDLGDLRIKAVKWHEKRSLNANAYFHVLCNDIANAKTLSGDTCSMTREKNLLISQYGQLDYIDGAPVVIKSNIPHDAMLEQESLHCHYIKASEDGGIFYYVMRGSHTYDSKEMVVLIEGAIHEAHEYNVNTLTPDETRRLLEEWQPKKA